jgi:hypothetical protein
MNETIQDPNLNGEVSGGRLQTSQSVGTLATSHVKSPITKSRRRCSGNRCMPAYCNPPIEAASHAESNESRLLLTALAASFFLT